LLISRIDQQLQLIGEIDERLGEVMTGNTPLFEASQDTWEK
jgi:hypothetical protein